MLILLLLMLLILMLIPMLLQLLMLFLTTITSTLHSSLISVWEYLSAMSRMLAVEGAAVLPILHSRGSPSVVERHLFAAEKRSLCVPPSFALVRGRQRTTDSLRKNYDELHSVLHSTEAGSRSVWMRVSCNKYRRQGTRKQLFSIGYFRQGFPSPTWGR